MNSTRCAPAHHATAPPRHRCPPLPTALFLPLALLLAAALAPVPAATACTIFSLCRGDTILVGCNTDYSDPGSRMWVVPASAGRHGRICFGFDQDYRIAEGGVNDAGLFIGVNALSERAEWRPDPARPDWEEWEGWFETGVPDGVLAMCATVEEALTVFRTYNLLMFAQVKYLLADSSGASAVVEWGEDGLTVLPARGGRQVSTNFVTSRYGPGSYPCYRYNLADRLLAEGADRPAWALARLVLSSTAMEFNTPTQYSLVCDLKRGTLQVFHYHNFEEPLALDLRATVRAGEARHRLRDLFAAPSYAFDVYRRFKEGS